MKLKPLNLKPGNYLLAKAIILVPEDPSLVLVINGGNQEVIQEWKGDDSLILVVAREIEPCISVLLSLNVLEMER